jgi:hypothetical protein
VHATLHESGKQLQAHALLKTLHAGLADGKTYAKPSAAAAAIFRGSTRARKVTIKGFKAQLLGGAAVCQQKGMCTGVCAADMSAPEH